MADAREADSRVLINVRIRPASLERIDLVAEEHRMTRSDVVRAALGFALDSRDFHRTLKGRP